MPSESEPERSTLTSRFQQMFPILSPAEIKHSRKNRT
jgi:hypothetical protein